ncbi:hypothetical protein PBAL39_13362 [Pedobacter sp. BAL39]|uniref:hypothetical protein n=1 Tax=Pedobacter sp. BAL39 TaxID=391596 RepID=UPI0001559871|nr:hypothetical protein [Pedobacter sp. BAL39]EDM35223.1 hypothetical protein PBAL39_13362 [Pedobacter sp. BAL39]
MKIYWLALFLICLTACSNAGKVMRAVDSDLEALANRSIEKEDGSVLYKIRIFPSKNILEEHKKTLNQSMMYHADSLFYLFDGKKKIYAMQSEPVMSGINGCYEYMVVFDAGDDVKAENQVLVYQDKFINQKRYELR